MNSKITKAQWVDEVMSSLEGISKAQPGDDLFERITSKLDRSATVKVIRLHPKQWAAAAVLLLALNISSVVYFESHQSKRGATMGSNPFAAEIQSESTYNY
jgi:hypothetical protein